MADRTARGFFITLEGGEGSGKSTLLKALAAHFEAHGQHVIVTREPGGTPLAEHIRNLVLYPPENSGQFSAMAEALLMNAARRDHVEKKIAPALRAGSFVICDRFADSTRVYQGYCGGVSIDALKQMDGHVLSDCRPNLTLILDVDAVVAKTRRLARGANDVFEARGDAFHAEVRAGFQSIAQQEPDRCVMIDANSDEAEVLSAALAEISVRLPT